MKKILTIYSKLKNVLGVVVTYVLPIEILNNSIIKNIMKDRSCVNTTCSQTIHII